VIVESAAEAREADWPKKLKTKQKQREDQKRQLLKLCEEMDQDDSGTISLEEMTDAWETSETFRNSMMYIDVHKEELQTIFRVVDVDGSGEVSYKNFVDQLYRNFFRSIDMRTMMASIMLELELITEKLSVPKYSSGPTRSAPRETRSSARAAKSQTGEPSVLAYHSRLLESIDSKLTSLCEERRGGSSDVGPGAAAPAGDPAVSTAGCPAEALPDLASELGLLQQRMGSLAALRSEVLLQAEAQAGALARQQERLAELQASLPWAAKGRGPVASVPSGLSCPPADEAVGSDASMRHTEQSLGRLRQHVDRRLSVILQDVNQRLKEEAEALTTSGELLDVLCLGLKEEAEALTTGGKLSDALCGLGRLPDEAARAGATDGTLNVSPAGRRSV